MMHKMTHVFDYLRLWDAWNNAEIEEIISDKTIATLQEAVHLLDDETKTDKRVITRDNFVSLVREMRELCGNGSKNLGEAIIKASEHADNQEYDEAIIIYKDFLSSCKSKFYRDIARGYIRKYSDQLKE